MSEFLHRNYTVVSQHQVDLVPGETTARVIVSRGPGTKLNQPVSGGTEDIQVLTYDQAAERWSVAFDAGQRVSQGVDPLPAPLLDQTHPIESAGAVAVSFTANARPSLAVYGLDGYTNHPSFAVAVLHFVKGGATLQWALTGSDADSQGLAKPQVIGSVGRQELSLTADLIGNGGACCPIREFNRLVGYTKDAGVHVVADDRPYLGVTLAPVLGQPGARVTHVDAGSPADGELFPGDIIAEVSGAPLLAVSSEAEPDPLATAIQERKARGTISLIVGRGSKRVTTTLTLSSILDTARSPAPPANGDLGITLDDSLTIVDGSEFSPLLNFDIQAGDRIVTVNGWDLTSPDQLAAALYGTAGSAVVVTLVDSAGARRTVTVTPIETSTEQDASIEPTPDSL